MVNKCLSIRPLISEFVDGTLSSDRVWSVQLHMSICPECAQIASSLGKTVDLVRGASPQPLSAGFDATLANRLVAARSQREQALQRSPLSRILFLLCARVAVDSPGIRHGLKVSAPLIVAATVMAFMVAFATSGPGARTGAMVAPDRNQVFINACQHEHADFVSAQPFADPSAQALMQRQTDDSLAKEGAVLLGSGNI